MNKRKVLLIGCGKTGNKLINEMMLKDARYTGIFVNSSYNDMANLEKFDKDLNAFLFPGVNGSGKNPEKAEEFVKGNIESLIDIISGYPMHDVITIFTSADGGTGSGTTPMLCQLLKQTFMLKKLTGKKINLVAVFPSLKSNDKLSFENAIRFWNKIMKIKDTCIDNIMIVDNTKGSNYKEINDKVVEALHNAYSMNGVHDDGEIDDGDARIFNTEKGFGLILNLEKGYKDATVAIDKAMDESIFALPNSLKCNYIGVSLCEDDYLIDDVLSNFPNIRRTPYKTYNQKHNTVVLSGCTAPHELIWNIKNAIDEMDKEDIIDVEEHDLIIEMNTKNKQTHISNEKPPVFTENDIEDIAATLKNLWG